MLGRFEHRLDIFDGNLDLVWSNLYGVVWGLDIVNHDLNHFIDVFTRYTHVLTIRSLTINFDSDLKLDLNYDIFR